MYAANVQCVCGYSQSEGGGGGGGPDKTLNWECDLSDRLARLHERLTRLRHENSVWAEGSRSRRSSSKGRFSGEGGSPNNSVSVCCSVLQCRARGCVCNGAVAIGEFVRRVPPLTARRVCVAVCCTGLQCVALCCREQTAQILCVFCSVLQYVAVCCNMLQWAAICCSAVQYAAVCCNMLWCAVVRCSVLQCAAVCCSVLLLVALCIRLSEEGHAFNRSVRVCMHMKYTCALANTHVRSQVCKYRFFTCI